MVDFWSTWGSFLVEFWVDPGVGFDKFLGRPGEAGGRLLGGLWGIRGTKVGVWSIGSGKA